MRSVPKTFAENKNFEYIVMTAILFNTVLLSVTWAGMSPQAVLTTEIINYVFTALFIIEAVSKICAYGKL